MKLKEINKDRRQDLNKKLNVQNWYNKNCEENKVSKE